MFRAFRILYRRLLRHKYTAPAWEHWRKIHGDKWERTLQK